MKITVLVENHVQARERLPLRGEHGLAMLLEHDGRLLLYDAGQSETTVHNMGCLGIDPARLSAIIISHGHYDHTGGLAAVLQRARKRLPVYALPEMFTARYVRKDGAKLFIGVPHRQEKLCSLGADFHFIREPLEIASRLWLSGPVPRGKGRETGDPGFVRQEGDKLVPDNIADDQSLYYVSDRGLVVICGCAHAGLINIVEYGLAVTGADKLAGVVGGTHLGAVPQEQCQDAVDYLAAKRPEFIAANHCTGFGLEAQLQARFGAVFRYAPAGFRLEIDEK